MTQGRMRQDLYAELFNVENNHWWHIHKRAIVHDFIERLIEPGKVLDIGAGTGKMLAELKRKGWQTAGVDGVKEAVRWSKKRGINIKQADLEKKLPFKENSFNLVLFLDVLEHLKKDSKVLAEIHRVLKPKGVVIITVPAYQWLFNYWDKMLGHKRRYSKDSLKKKITKLNLFKIEHLGYFSMFILLPSIWVRLVKKLFGRTKVSDFQTTPLSFASIPTINFFNKIERRLISFMSLPFGLSVVCVIRKK